MFNFRVIPAFLLVFSLLCSTAVSANEESAYREGMEAFRSADFPRALEHFQQAEADGLSTVALSYNLGSTHYRLGNYDESARYFGGIRDDARWGALAEYNLGLIAERQDDPERATEHYQQAYQKADSDRVRELAQARLSVISDSAAVRRPEGWQVYLSGALGSDDNPALTQDTQLMDHSGSDTFAEVIGNVSGYLSGSQASGVRLSTGVYSRQYSSLSQFSVTGVDAGLYLDRRTDNWLFVRGVRASNFWIDGDQYSTGANLMLQATQRNKIVNLDIRNNLGYLSGGDGFDFISGISNRLSLDIFQRRDSLEWRLGYRNEYNDREDLATDAGQFFSYSPMRHAFYGQLRNELSDRVSLRTRLEYRKSLYADDNREIDPDTEAVTQARREEDRMSFSTLLRYSLNRTFSTFAEYRYTDNASNFSRFSYNSNQVMLGIESIF